MTALSWTAWRRAWRTPSLAARRRLSQPTLFPMCREGCHDAALESFSDRRPGHGGARGSDLFSNSAEASDARREMIQPVAVNPADPRVKTSLFWASDAGDSTLAPVTVELPLSRDPVPRSKQVLNTLLAGPVDVELRTLPPDAVLLGFYLLPDGTAIADFSEALATSIPSGIVSEQLAVDSITRTLEANVPQVQRLKILIHGQEVETLAGHVDLSGTFVVHVDAVTPVNPASAPADGK